MSSSWKRMSREVIRADAIYQNAAQPAAARGAVGLGTLARSIDEWGGIRAVERLNLDGLLALWHPASKN